MYSSVVASAFFFIDTFAGSNKLQVPVRKEKTVYHN